MYNHKHNKHKDVLPIVKVAANFGVHILGIPIPKNSLYLKLTEGYVYVTDFKQFETRKNSVKVHILWNTKKSFREEYIDLNSLAGKLFSQKIKDLNYYDTKVIINITQNDISAVAPKDREIGDYNFKPTNRINFSKTTDFDVKPQWKI